MPFTGLPSTYGMRRHQFIAVSAERLGSSITEGSNLLGTVLAGYLTVGTGVDGTDVVKQRRNSLGLVVGKGYVGRGSGHALSLWRVTQRGPGG